MAWSLRALTRQNVFAVVAGVVLAGAPLIAFDFWLNGVINRQGQEEVDTSAKRAISLAESRTNDAVDALDELAAQGVDSCSPAAIDKMRVAVFRTAPVKEIEILGPDGQRLCSHLGMPEPKRAVVSTEPLPGVGGFLLEVLQLGEGKKMVRLRRKVGVNEIAACMPASFFLPLVSTQGGPFSGHAHIVSRAGTLIGQLGGKSAEKPDASFTAQAESDKFGFAVAIAAPRGRLAAGQSDLKWLGIYASGSIVLIVGAIVWLLPRRGGNNPIAEIERALAAGEFVPYYQPIVDIRSGQLRGAEVLVRWKKPDGSLVLPGAFIPLAESSGLIRDMTCDLMRRVCAEAGEAIGRRPALKVSFNFAGQLFGDESIIKDVRKIFSGEPIKLSQVVLELTERDPIENFTETHRVIAALQGLDIRIAIDDVGTGHSGLSYILKLGVDIIKIDKMIVDAIGTDRNSTTIVETLIDLAHNMRMDIVAEGVENFEQVMHLRELGVRLAQGYVFAPPLPGSAFLQLIEAIDPMKAVADIAPPVLAVSAA
jgi:sensor c-di-GMP phosphodiesterase-like protein